MADEQHHINDLPKLFASLRGCDAEHYKQTERYAKQVQKLFDTATRELCGLATRWQQNIASDPDEPFAFDAFPRTKRQAQGFITRLVGKVTQAINCATRQEWLAACEKNDAFLGNILRTSKLTPDEIQQYQDRNIEALNGFQQRKADGMTLSDRVWNIAGQFRQQVERAIEVALGEGKPAAELSRDVRDMLNDPQKLFRRVRDKDGNLRLSKAAAAFHPGQGVCRSSYKNAMRLARTEVNMAYRQSEYLRWQQLDFVVGLRIWLSNNHTTLGPDGKPQPFHDICDELAGDYPKTFKFVGWHPQCRCVVTPIMKSYKEYNAERAGRLKAIVRGETYKSLPARREITDVPQKFRAYIQSISQKSKGWKNQPYYIRDNFKGGTIDGGLNIIIPQRAGQISGTTKAPAPQPCTKYDKQIAKIKALSYSFGLDCSTLDALRTAGNEAALEAKLEELLTLQTERYGQWAEAEKEFTDLYDSLPATATDLRNAFLDKFGEGYKNNKYADGRYYADCIGNLKGLVSKARQWLGLQPKYKTIISDLKTRNVDYLQPQKHKKQLDETAIIRRVGGADRTGGSCASAALAYVGNKLGYDVLDFRGDAGRDVFSTRSTLKQLTKELGGKITSDTNDVTAATTILQGITPGKEYYFVCGCHAVIIRKGVAGLEYLELQAKRSQNGFKPFDPATTIPSRFAGNTNRSRDVDSFLIELDAFKANIQSFEKLLGYINTNSKSQMKGRGGGVK